MEADSMLNSAPPIIRIAFLDVGQADTIVVSSPQTREAIIIDCVDYDAVLTYLEQEDIRHLRGVVITHLHTDHFAGVPALLKNCQDIGLECEKLAVNLSLPPNSARKMGHDTDNHCDSYEEVGSKTTTQKPHKKRIVVDSVLHDLRDWIARNSEKITGLTTSRNLPFNGELNKAFTILHPHDSHFWTLAGVNDTSIVLRVSGPGTSALLTGDIEPKGWQAIQTAKHEAMQFSCNVLKFPHHGAWSDPDVDSVLNTVDPSIVVISVGSEGYEQYKHPNSHVFSAMATRPKIRLLCTQVTNQCIDGLWKDKRKTITGLYSAASTGSQKLLSQRGCPCAGTVIIELDHEVRVVQPEVNFHRQEIIEPNFIRHQCKF